jgi:hypothetical protein
VSKCNNMEKKNLNKKINTKVSYIILEEINKCCSACFNRISRKLGTGSVQSAELVIPVAPESSEG